MEALAGIGPGSDEVTIVAHGPFQDRAVCANRGQSRKTRLVGQALPPANRSGSDQELAGESACPTFFHQVSRGRSPIPTGFAPRETLPRSSCPQNGQAPGGGGGLHFADRLTELPLRPRDPDRWRRAHYPGRPHLQKRWISRESSFLIGEITAETPSFNPTASDVAGSLWSTRGRLWRSTAACSLKAGPDSRHELLEVALAPDVLPQLRRDRVGCMLVVARMP